MKGLGGALSLGSQAWTKEVTPRRATGVPPIALRCVNVSALNIVASPLNARGAGPQT
jgi:hypothetical protein